MRVGAGDHAAIVVDVGHRDLDGAVVLGLDEAACRGALARDVEVNEIALSSREHGHSIVVIVRQSLDPQRRALRLQACHTSSSFYLHGRSP